MVSCPLNERLTIIVRDNFILHINAAMVFTCAFKHSAKIGQVGNIRANVILIIVDKENIFM